MRSELGCSQSEWGKQSVLGEQGEVRLAKEEKWEAPVLEKKLWFLQNSLILVCCGGSVEFQTPLLWYAAEGSFAYYQCHACCIHPPAAAGSTCSVGGALVQLR